MFISKKKYNELVESRDHWREHAYRAFSILERNTDNLQKIAYILEKAYGKGEK